MKEILVIEKVEWSNLELVAHQIINIMMNLGGLDAQEYDLETLFGMFQTSMSKRIRIPKIVVEK
jgi:hypothetical protein